MQKALSPIVGVTGELAGAQNRTIEPKRLKQKILLSMHLLCIGLFATFLVWGLEGKTPINGDDVRVIRKVVLRSVDFKYNYLQWTRSRLHVLGVLDGNYKIAGENIETANLMWLAFYVASAFAAYAYLRKIVSPGIALSGAIFYLCYSSKFEPLTWWSAGAYTLVWLAFFGLLNLLESKAKYATKAVGVALIVSATLHVYEVLVVLAPFFSLILLLRRRREVSKLRARDWGLGMLPIVVVLVHVVVLATTKTPLYLANRELNQLPIVERVERGLISAIDSTIGPKHNSQVKSASHSYERHYKFDYPVLPIVLTTAIGVTLLTWLASLRWTVDFAANPTTLVENASIGLIALFLSAFIGFVSNQYVTPSRLTGVPSIGLMIAICAGLEFLLCAARKLAKPQRVALISLTAALSAVAFIYSVREVKAFACMLRQCSETRDFDMQIAQKIKAIHPVAAAGEEIYVRIPRAKSEVIGRWTNFWSGFSSGRANETLWYLYDVDPGHFEFTSTPFKIAGEEDRLQPIVEGWASHGIDKVVPFYVDENSNVYPISTLVLSDKNGQTLKTLDFSAKFANLANTEKVAQTVGIKSLPSQLR